MGAFNPFFILLTLRLIMEGTEPIRLKRGEAVGLNLTGQASFACFCLPECEEPALHYATVYDSRCVCDSSDIAFGLPSDTGYDC